MFEHINTLSILVSAILAVAVGNIWYSPLLFGPAWRRSIGRTIDEGVSQQEMIKSAIQGVFAQIIFFSIVAQFISLSISGLITLSRVGMLLAALLASYVLISLLGERRSGVYFLINAGYMTIILFGGIGVIAYWPW